MKDKLQLFDVVIFERESKVIDTIAGRNMRFDEGHYNAQRRLGTVLDRLNDRYDADIVPAGKFNKGDKLP